MNFNQTLTLHVGFFSSDIASSQRILSLVLKQTLWNGQRNLNISCILFYTESTNGNPNFRGIPCQSIKLFTLVSLRIIIDRREFIPKMKKSIVRASLDEVSSGEDFTVL